MIESLSRRASLRAALSTAAVLALAWGSTACKPVPIASGSTTTSPSATSASPAAGSTSEADWQAKMSAIDQPGPGCFQASYPNLAWVQVACTTPPAYPQPPAVPGPRPSVSGILNDVTAYVPSARIVNALGSFDRVVGVLGETGPVGNAGPKIPNAYSLQLNTNHFNSQWCSGSTNPECMGWEQFVFDNAGVKASVYIEYWLIQYNMQTCPDPSWNKFSFTGETDVYCWKRSDVMPVPPVPIVFLASLKLLGIVNNRLRANDDVVRLWVGRRLMFSTAGPDIGAAGAWTLRAPGIGWNEAEFNVLGDGGNSNGGGMASFLPFEGLDIHGHIDISALTTTISPWPTAPVYTSAAAVCESGTFTAETNNLKFAAPPPPPAPVGPSLVFHENLKGGAKPPCAGAMPS
jgi:hypothetical protein